MSLTAACGSVDGDECSVAAEQVAACLGQEQPTLPDECDDESRSRAQQVLDMECSEIQAMQASGGKADGICEKYNYCKDTCIIHTGYSYICGCSEVLEWWNYLLCW